MSADCMKPLLNSYIQQQREIPCPSAPVEAASGCLCASDTFTVWYLSTLCINCNGAQILQNPVSNLTMLCPAFTGIIEARYPGGCRPYAKLDAPLATTLSEASVNASSGLITSSSSSSSPSSSSNSSSTFEQTTIILSELTPTQRPSTTSLSTVTASAIIPAQETQPFQTSPRYTSSPIVITSATDPIFTADATATHPVTGPSTSSHTSSGAKVGIGFGALAAIVGMAFVFLALLFLLRRRKNRMNASEYGYGHHEGDEDGEVRRGSDTSTTVAESILGEVSQYRDFGGSDRYETSGLGIMGIGIGREKMGLVPSGRIREVNVDGNGDIGSEFAAPSVADGGQEMSHCGRTPILPEDSVLSPRESGAGWLHAIQEQGSWTRCADQDGEAQHITCVTTSEVRKPHRHDSEIRSSMIHESIPEPTQPCIPHSTAQEFDPNAALRSISRIHEVVDSPVLDLGQGDVSREELERLAEEEEERRIDEAIRESESRAHLRADGGSMWKALGE